MILLSAWLCCCPLLGFALRGLDVLIRSAVR
jgi:hypothetical protein